MNRITDRSWIVMVLVFALIAGTVFFICEFVMNAEDWVFSAGSPHVFDGVKIESGIITDRDGNVLLNLEANWTYAADEAVRKSTLHWVGDRLGYIHAPLLSRYARQMTGYDLVNGVYAYGNIPGIMELTLSSEIQAAALEAFGDYKGTIAVYNYKTGELLCAVTTPTYDPDDVPDIEGDETGVFDGVYLNRFIQSTYTPGSIFKLVTAAAALETIPDIREQTFECTGRYEVGGGAVTCESVHGHLTFEDALAQSCNCSFALIVQQVGRERMERYAEQFGITSAVSFDGFATAAGNYDVEDAWLLDFCWSGIGQHYDLINPCQYMTFMGAIASGGTVTVPHVVDRISVGGDVTYNAETVTGERIMSQTTAEVLQQMMRNNVEVKYGAENFPDLTVCAKSGTAEMDNDRASNAMFAGFVADEEYPLAFIVAVQEGGYGARTCVPILSQVLEVCKEVLDAE